MTGVQTCALPISKKESFLFLETEAEAERIPISRIVYAEAFSHTAALYLTPEKAGESLCSREAKLCLGDLEERLPGNVFLRCHRSYLVHLPYVRRIGRNEVFLEYGASVPVSRGKRAQLYQAFLEYHRRAEE